MPKPGVTWQWQLTGTVDTSVDAQMYDVDLFTTDDYGARGEVITAFAASLGTAGLDELECLARERLGHGPAGKLQYLASALENIADARGDGDLRELAKALLGCL